VSAIDDLVAVGRLHGIAGGDYWQDDYWENDFTTSAISDLSDSLTELEAVLACTSQGLGGDAGVAALARAQSIGQDLSKARDRLTAWQGAHGTARAAMRLAASRIPTVQAMMDPGPGPAGETPVEAAARQGQALAAAAVRADTYLNEMNNHVKAAIILREVPVRPWPPTPVPVPPAEQSGDDATHGTTPPYDPTNGYQGIHVPAPPSVPDGSVQPGDPSGVSSPVTPPHAPPTNHTGTITDPPTTPKDPPTGHTPTKDPSTTRDPSITGHGVDGDQGPTDALSSMLGLATGSGWVLPAGGLTSGVVAAGGLVGTAALAAAMAYGAGGVGGVVGLSGLSRASLGVAPPGGLMGSGSGGGGGTTTGMMAPMGAGGGGGDRRGKARVGYVVQHVEDDAAGLDPGVGAQAGTAAELSPAVRVDEDSW